MRSAAEPIVLAVDGGNVKTDLALLTSAGELLSLVRGGRSSPHYVGVDGCIELLEDLIRRALSGAGLDPVARPLAAVGQIMVAGADLPEELSALRAALDSLRWAQRLVVENDTFALLRSGTDRGWGVAVVCGGGINCVGVAPDGREVRFPSLGQITGDWGGGHDVGLAALTAASRSADGRGKKTSLEQAVPQYFGLAEPFDVARALHVRALQFERLSELARVVFAHADVDGEAGEIVERLFSEVVAFAVATLRRLELTGDPVDVVLGGGLIRAAPQRAIEGIAASIRDVAPVAGVRIAPSAPIVGAALLGLDELGAGPEALDRARVELSASFIKIEGDGSRVYSGAPVATVPIDHELVRRADG